MEKPDRRPVSLAGLGLIGAGAVLGLTLAAPASAAGPSETGASATAAQQSEVVPPPAERDH